MTKNDPIIEDREQVEGALKTMTTVYICQMLIYSAFTLFWIWNKIWIIVGINYLVMIIFTHNYQKEKWLFRYWKELRMYEGYDLKKAGEV